MSEYHTLGEHQEIFAQHLARLIIKASEMGFTVRVGEVWRPQEMQDIYYKSGMSKTRTSQHLKKLAADLNLFIEGKMANKEQVAPLGEWWESLDELNRWGGSWRGKIQSGEYTFIDSPHFERAA